MVRVWYDNEGGERGFSEATSCWRLCCWFCLINAPMGLGGHGGGGYLIRAFQRGGGELERDG